MRRTSSMRSGSPRGGWAPSCSRLTRLHRERAAARAPACPTRGTMSASPTRAPVRSVVLAWLLSRAGLMAAVLVIARLAGIGPEGHPLASRIWALDRFAYWDSFHYVRIAELGYLPPGLPCCDQAFFPGYPA